ncbi:MAG: acyltransferase [Flavobacteriales bacterium]|nr:1-acyl-sn-glycerol-3-phosphate acyltransferase [Bacteroidales bacterium AH-315-I05]PCJ88794.1 MAG: acyltransferase [Flavobacteriales bacterium]
MIQEIKKWPIVKLTQDREAFLEEVIADSIKNIHLRIKRNGSVHKEIEKTLYFEKIRMSEKPWKVDPKDETPYWNSIKTRLLQTALEKEDSEIRLKNESEITENIVNRYAHEIAGKFDIGTYKLAHNVVPMFFSRLLNTAAQGNFFQRFWSSSHRLRSRIYIKGNIKHIRNLANKGTLVLTPTHFSNLDSILVGYCLDEIGLPPFLYGAGLNLYNNRFMGYFINRLGAYKVDRRKKNRFYLETLKSYSRISMIRNCHTLFFPGGTRSRSGEIETRLKLGLLGTALDAQLYNFQNSPEGQAKKIFVLPMVIGYHFVLEAPSLIREHLKRTGKEKYYIDRDQFSSSYKVFKFMWNFFGKGSRIILSFGKPMDLFGNYVDFDGKSFGKDGREINIRKYFLTEGELKSVPQRDFEYTKMLSDRIVAEYLKTNMVMSSHLIAFAAFEMLKKKFNADLDVYGLLRITEEDREIPYQQFAETLERLRTRLFELKAADKVQLAAHCEKDIEAFIRHGTRNLGLYHSKKVLFRNKKGNITTQDMNLLYYYRNRMEGYELEGLI